MKHPITPIAVIIVVVPLLTTSCYSYKSITKRSPVTQETLSKLETGKEYQFELGIGEIQTIYITSINAEDIEGYVYQGGKTIKSRKTPSVSTITGQVAYHEEYIEKTKTAYADSRENILNNVVKISQRKADPIKTIALIIVPVGLIFSLWVLSHLPFQ